MASWILKKSRSFEKESGSESEDSSWASEDDIKDCVFVNSQKENGDYSKKSGALEVECLKKVNLDRFKSSKPKKRAVEEYDAKEESDDCSSSDNVRIKEETLKVTIEAEKDHVKGQASKAEDIAGVEEDFDNFLSSDSAGTKYEMINVTLRVEKKNMWWHKQAD
ncbi:hypothetical protein QYF36_021425 [Acer negundo]|nr:hypothetical protein QYF36_021425 [Acer negundo]